MSSEIEIETIPGLPGELPKGERVLWQGRPEWKALARRTFKVRWLAAYFTVFASLRLVNVVKDHQGREGALQLAGFIGLGIGCLAVLSFLAWLYARATIYTVTTKRVVMRIGVALPMTWNLPFKRLAAADLVARAEGDGDVSLQLTAPNRVAWLHLWPHVQPWHYAKARPTFRAIAEPARVASILADAVAEWSRAERSAPVVLTSHEEITAKESRDVGDLRDLRDLRDGTLVLEAGR